MLGSTMKKAPSFFLALAFTILHTTISSVYSDLFIYFLFYQETNDNVSLSSKVCPIIYHLLSELSDPSVPPFYVLQIKNVSADFDQYKPLL